MIDQFGAILLAALLIATGIVWAVGPARLLVNAAAALIAVPVTFAVVAVVLIGIWLTHHGL